MNEHYQNEPQTKKLLLFFKKPRVCLQMPNRRLVVPFIDWKVVNNRISSNKYTPYNFVPKSLLIQFHHYCNLYFLGIGFLQIIEKISNTDGQPTIYIPLVFILLLTMVKDLYEEVNRYKYDKLENEQIVQYYDSQKGQFRNIMWQNIHIGMVLKISNNQQIPCDMLILQQKHNDRNIYIETKNLDGETNLKFKTLNNKLKKFSNIDQVIQSGLAVNYEKPNQYLYNFNGNIEINRQTSDLNNDNIVLRGCYLKNTDYIYGLALYTGVDSKIMINSVDRKTKKSSLEKKMDYLLLTILILKVLLCLYAGFMQFFSQSKLEFFKEQMTKNIDNDFEWVMINFGRWVLLFTNFVPISLLISLEFVKLFQCLIVKYDKNLSSKYVDYEGKEQIQYGQVKQCNLIEELGQIQHIFSDKTGTLTQNVMEFRKLIVDGKLYGDDQSLNIQNISQVNFRDQYFKQDIEQQSIKNILTYLALCHSITTDEQDNYIAQSPDELALIQFCKQFHYVFKGRKDNMIILKVNGTVQKWELIRELEFSSERKKMSVVVRNVEDDQYILICKGADNVIKQILKSSGDKDESDSLQHQQLIRNTYSLVQKCAEEGLRTLVIGYRVLEKQEAICWNEQYQDALNSLDLVQKDITIKELQQKIEKQLLLLASTAIEDKLQEDVDITIEKFRSVGIKIWVLTGDKVETAINVGLSCKLLDKDQKLVVLNDQIRLEEKIQQNLLETRPFSVIVVGDVLAQIQKNQNSIDLFIKLCNKSQTILACRTSPKQKSEIVNMVRYQNITQPDPEISLSQRQNTSSATRQQQKDQSVITLAVGDGANDVNMILQAHVGIGISGKEGQQATNNSDFSITQFKHLQRLLLFVGRESYRKNSVLILYMMQKNIILVFTHYFLGFYTSFNTYVMYDVWLYQFFNLFFAQLSIAVYAVFDKQFKSENHLSFKNQKKNPLEDMPIYYRDGMENYYFNIFIFWKNQILGMVYSGILFYCIYIQQSITEMANGLEFGFNLSGNILFFGVITVCNLLVYVKSYMFYSLYILSMFVGIFSYVLFAYVAHNDIWFSSFNIFYQIFENLNTYFSMFVSIGFILTIESLSDYLQNLSRRKFKIQNDNNMGYTNLQTNEQQNTNKLGLIDKGCIFGPNLQQFSIPRNTDKHNSIQLVSHDIDDLVKPKGQQMESIQSLAISAVNEFHQYEDSSKNHQIVQFFKSNKVQTFNEIGQQQPTCK